MIRANVRAMAGYVPGEQPRGGAVIKLNTNESPYPPSPRVAAAVQELLAGDQLRRYPDPTGRHFREVAAALHGCDPDGILIGNGSDDILTVVTRACVPERGLIAAPTPSYLLYTNLAEIQGARFQTVPFTPDWRLPDPWPVADAHLTFVPNPNSPTGTAVPIEDLAHLADGYGGALLIDEAYVDFADGDAVSLTRRPNVIVSRTFSKAHGLAGIRFGYAVADPAVVRELLKVKDSYNCDALSLAAAAAALADRDYLHETVRRVTATRERLAAGLAALGFAVTPSRANFVWCRRADRPVKPLAEALRERRILIRYMNYAGYGDGLRISVGTDAETDRLLAELRPLV